MPLFEGTEITDHTEYLSYVCQLSQPGLDWAEFGTGEGYSASILLRHLWQDSKFWLFDSFKGLPDYWKEDCPKGSFACDPPVFEDSRVAIVTGMFEDTVAPWSVDKKQLGLIHIDCDLYASTKTVLKNIDHLIGYGTIIMFDEMIGTHIGFEEHELKAFIEEISGRYQWKTLATTGLGQVSFLIHHRLFPIG